MNRKNIDAIDGEERSAGKLQDLDLSAGKVVGAAVQAARLMTYAANRRTPWSAPEVTRELGMNPSTCFNLIQTLLAVGWLASAELIGPGKRYVLGGSFVNLAHRTASRTVVLRDVMPRLQEYADRWKVTATIWQRQSLTRMELVAVTHCQTAINVQMPIGKRLPILMGGMGRIMATQAGFDDATLVAIFNSLRWDRPLTFAQFMAQARKAKRVGWGLDDGYMNRSVTALSVPVMPTADGSVEYVCSATMFRHQYASAVLPSLADGLMPIASSAQAIIYGDQASNDVYTTQG
ncbi:IclR family transcriptional regulator [Bordetella tumulicola]|uniref:IclR family transcriptional regulator n=1 Tax=Bordetella tumulicola TaxID=1649133 RepID=UPI0039F0687A